MLPTTVSTTSLNKDSPSKTLQTFPKIVPYFPFDSINSQFSFSIFLSSDCEASVMLANSWLYHYYSVHTKIQFGLPYEGTTRIPPTTSYYHHSPTIPGSLTHPYHLSYGFASGMQPHQGSPGLINHHNGSSTTNHGSNAGSEHFRSHSYRIDPLQPIDYSQTTPLNIQIDSRYGSNKGNSPSGNLLKRNAIARLEPLHIAGSKNIIDVSTVELHSQSTDGSTVLLTTVIPTRHRFYTKVMPVDSTEFMDQWNPSPPWSESAQKVPDIIQQDLSPYLTTTPPTPTSAPLHPSHTNHGPAFSFDWMPEQFVPVISNSASSPPTQNNSVHCQSTTAAHWSTNRIISMDIDRRSSDDDTRSE